MKMPDSFTIKCNSCGKEVNMEDIFFTSSDKREIYPDFDPLNESISIKCNCGNQIDEF
jgi:hypothetical protein